VASLAIVSIYVGEQHEMLERLSRALEGPLGLDVHVRAARFDPEVAFDPARGQYNSTTLLRYLLDDGEDDAPRRDGDRILGVTGVDLFIPVLTFVYGEAQLEGPAAVVSLHRLRPEAYGVLPDPALLFDRLVKEALHELGHTFGLLHCANPTCVMRASTYVEEIDFKSSAFCGPCGDRARRRR